MSSETPEAWQYGPVYRSVYNAFSGFGARAVDARAYIRGTEIPIDEKLSDPEEALIKMVVKSYGKLSAYALSNLTHKPGTPWSKAYEQGLYSKIGIDEMQSHFESLKATRLVKRETA